MRCATAAILVLGSGAVLSGCMSSPTYGTDKTANEQLVGDLTGVLSLTPKKAPPIDYKPRPELVRPVKGGNAALPAPQDSIVTANASAWPESPEQRLSRIRADATANRDKPGFEPEVENDIPVATASVKRRLGSSEKLREAGVLPPGEGVADQRVEVQERLAENRQGDSTKRKYLSEPPLTYREPSATAPTDQLGEDEVKKERRRKAEAKGSRKWDLWPF